MATLTAGWRKRTLRLLRSLSQFETNRDPALASMAGEALALIISATPMRKVQIAPTIRQVRATRRQKRKTRTADIRARLVLRAHEACEACGGTAEPLELDHYYGGRNRRSHESFETCWLLCGSCHRGKTSHVPSTAYWQEKFDTHRFRYGYDGIRKPDLETLEASR